eukprot:4198855-Pyramimonas_sp.AAC.1
MGKQRALLCRTFRVRACSGMCKVLTAVSVGAWFWTALWNSNFPRAIWPWSFRSTWPPGFWGRLEVFPWQRSQ